ncbi:hypothetical protein FKV42_00270 [Methanolobus vulcani]|uniref:NPCBM-associated, NEW3 domain of alpha-galactosidase n=2 Tax=Methanolobus vulcani TaxID=38026 RepID=A0A7Z8P2M2_9EURY|nr:hypothetical protein FKV42_00270 [Methanolobus vulcani]
MRINTKIPICSLIVSMLLVGVAFIPGVSAEDVIYTASDEQIIHVDDQTTLYQDFDFAKLSINPSYANIQIKPGNTDEITITVTNKDNKTITIEPKAVLSPYQNNFLDESWISITPASKDLEPDAKQEFTIEVNIPEDTDIGNYGTQIAFTDDAISASYSVYPEYINAMYLYIDVWTPPRVEIGRSYIYDHVESGETYDYEIQLKNIGDDDIAIDPEMSDEMGYYGFYGNMGSAFESDAIHITAPAVIKAGETAVVNVHLDVPDDAKGEFYGDIDLNIDDPSMNEWDDEVSLNFEVWTQPSEPYIKEFTTKTNDLITIEISSITQNYARWMGTYSQDENEEASFDLTLANESGNVELNLVKTTYSGTVSLDSSNYPPWEIDGAGIYQDSMTSYVETYEVPGAIGEWTLNILPMNAEEFGYSITIGDTE